MGIPGIDLGATRFPVRVTRPTADGGGADAADVMYGIHRCTHGHRHELPDGCALLLDAGGAPRLTRMIVKDGPIRFSDRLIFGLLAVAVLSPANKHKRTAEGYFLTFSATTKMVINEWWGRAAEFQQLPEPILCRL